MPVPQDDLQFEAELKRFRSRAASPLPGGSRKPPKLRWPALVAATVTIAFAGVILWRASAPKAPTSEAWSQRTVSLGRAQMALARGDNFEATIEQLERESRPQEKHKPEKNMQSAFQVLGKEEP